MICVLQVGGSEVPTSSVSVEADKGQHQHKQKLIGNRVLQLIQIDGLVKPMKEWRLWRELLKESPGIGWCPSKKTIDATEEWWAEKIQENPDFKGFKKKGIEPRLNDLMWQMFGGIVATGENAWAPSSGVLPNENSNENEGIPPNEVPSNPSHETPNRRKETLGVVHGKGKKSSSSRKSSRNSLATHIEKLCESMSSPRKSVNEIIFPHSQYTISNAMDALRDLGDEIPKKDELYYFAIKMFQISVKREVFLNLDPDVRVWWLRREYAEQNPIASFSSLLATSSFPFQLYHPPPPP
ncbi:L10-interacting MYB domain-containing protein-like [Gossypium arboreum]|uniref:L10-interacting MYB domain-containing protein-like n=1 Tax=Gossypium arboreum TaxID=29729 RepID=UPI0008195A3C|nr:L10-interacting MYB domain-containing protein-like [Gossypium arboreum]